MTSGTGFDSKSNLPGLGKKSMRLAPLDNAPDPKINGEFDKLTDMAELNAILKLDIAKTFNSSVLKIALNLKEDRIAAIITAFFPVRIDEESINRACRSFQIDFLYCVFAYNKNYQEEDIQRV